MAARMTVKQRSCLPLHSVWIYITQVQDRRTFQLKTCYRDEVPYIGVACEYRMGDNSKFVHHQDSPGHTEKVDPIQNIIAQSDSATPRYLIMGQDVIKLSKEDRTEHWLAVGYQTDDEENDTEDIRPQLLRHEPMRLTSPSGPVPVPEQMTTT